MGHMINPVSTRIGRFSYWEDFWFVEHAYYPEYLHSLLKIKLFLVNFFEKSLYENNKILYSHFDFVCHNGLVIIRVYLYFVGFFQHLNLFFSELSEEFIVFSRLSGRDRACVKNVSVIFILFKLITNCEISGLLAEKSIFNAFFSFDFYLLKKLLFSKRYLEVDEEDKFDFLFFFSTFIFLCKQLEKRVYLTLILERLYVSFVSYKFWRPFFLCLRVHILTIINYLFPIFESWLSLNFYLISNEGLTSKFISRFIGVRLTYNLSLSEVIDPIRGDLLSSMEFFSSSRARFVKEGADYVNVKGLKLFYKGLFKRLVLIFNSIYFRYFFFLFCKTFSWITLESFFFFFLVRGKSLSLNRLIGFSKAYSKNKAIFCLFFNSNIVFLKSLLLPTVSGNASLDRFVNIDFFFSKVFTDFESLYFPLVNKLESDFYDRSVYLCFSFLKRKITFDYNMLIFFLCNHSVKAFRRGEPRDKILGFKIHVSGRLSRKDRASDVWFAYGRVPANTFSASMDYGFYTVPLLNSLVRIKVWINRGITDEVWWYLRIC